MLSAEVAQHRTRHLLDLRERARLVDFGLAAQREKCTPSFSMMVLFCCRSDSLSELFSPPVVL